MYYGLDVHKDEIQICKLISETGDSNEQSRIPNTEERLEGFAKSLTEKDHLVFEASFNSWHVHAILKRHTKARVVVANAHKVGLIAHARIKTDKIDAFVLAKLLRADFIPEVQLPSDYAWQLRQLSYHRRFLVKQRTANKNSIRALLNKNLIVCPYSTPFTIKGRHWLRTLKLSEVEILIMDNALSMLEAVEKSIKQVDLKVIDLGKKDHQIQLLLSIPGVDLTCALGLIAAIDDIGKFESPEKLASYFGLVPTVSQSGNTCHHGRITKAGSKNARWLLVEAAQAMALGSCPLAGTYHRVKVRKGHNKAIVALARKIAVVVWHILKKGQPYRYAPSARTREKLRKLDPSTPAIDRGQVAKMDIEDVYTEFGVPLPQAPTAGEKRAAAINRRAVTNSKKRSRANAEERNDNDYEELMSGLQKT